jgi:predicted Fe-S protein YdhL (DUF1289 family)
MDLRKALGTRRVAAAQCPGCGRTNDAATCATERGATPKSGDFTVCLGCGAKLTFTKSLALRKMTEDERRILFRQDPQALEMLDGMSREAARKRTTAWGAR